MSDPKDPQLASDLTVAIATIARVDDLACCLKAVLENSVLPGELIVVDQDPAQSARALVESLSGQPFPVIYVAQQRRGLSASRNGAIQNATRPWIAFTDDDCAPAPGWIATIENEIQANPSVAAMSGSVLPMGPETPETFSISPRESPRRMVYTGRQIPWLVGTGGNFAVRRSWFEQAGRFDERLGAGSPGKAGEDSEMIYRLLQAGAQIVYAPDMRIYHKRQDRARRFSTRWTYGFGIGAFCGLWLRRRDGYVLALLVGYLLSLFRQLAGNLLRWDGLEVRQRLLSIGGTLSGVWYGLRARQVKP